MGLISGLSCSIVLLAALPGGRPAYATAPGLPAIYTLNADFDQGTLVNVNHSVPDQLQLGDAKPFNFIWVAASDRGTVVKIDTRTGAILGEYHSAPDARAKNPSRTTVDSDGNVWTTNRDEAANCAAGSSCGSVIKIGLKENNQCVDRNGNGTIETSTGLGDIKPWPNGGGVDDNGGVTTAQDECILLYTRLPNAPNARHVSVDSENNVWVGGYPYYPTTFHKLASATGDILNSFDAAAIGCGGYGGLIDANGVLWSAGISQSTLLRYDLNTQSGQCLFVDGSYGLGVDNINGKIWNASYYLGGAFRLDLSGTIEGFFSTNGAASRSVVVAPADHNVWVANSGSDTVARLDAAGTFITNIPVGSTPTGVAVDGDGKVWVTNYSSSTVMRIDPASNTVDLTVNLGPGAGPYNYSDMTGSTLIAPPETGAWTVVHDTQKTNLAKVKISWNGSTPGDSSLAVTRACSGDGIVFGPEQTVTNGVSSDTGPDCRYVKANVAFRRSTTDNNNDGIKDSPILYDLTISSNEPPVCTGAYPSPNLLWPPNHQMVPVAVLGVTDPDGDPINIAITSIFQDEPVNTYGDGSFTPDGSGIGTAVAELRAERVGTPKVPGNGRVYHIAFTADDGNGGTCSGSVAVGVPHDQGKRNVPIDEGALYDSTATSP